MSVMNEFLGMAKGLHVWIDLPSCDCPLEGKVEKFDQDHVMLSCRLGVFVVAIADIASAHIAVQAEIV